jgi:hypothetical protein
MNLFFQPAAARRPGQMAAENKGLINRVNGRRTLKKV